MLIAHNQMFIRQIERLNGRLQILQDRSDRYTQWRLILFILAVILSGISFVRWGPIVWIIASVFLFIPFGVVVAIHRKIDHALTQLTIWRDLKAEQLARLTLDWNNLPDSLPLPSDVNDHPFALDLDIVGERSLHQLLDTAVTIEGSHRLRDWLLDTQPDFETVQHRQNLVSALKPLSMFRERLRLYAREATRTDQQEKWAGQRLLDWLNAQPEIASLRPMLIFLTALALLNGTLWVLNMADVIPPYWGGTWALYAIISLAQIRKVGTMSDDSFFLRDGLEQLEAVFGFLEQYRYREHDLVADLCRPFWDEGQRPSRQLKRIRRVVSAASIQRNPFAWLLINTLIPWDIYFAYRFHQVRADLQAILPLWLDRWFELEALNSLANFAYLNPKTTFPEIRNEGLENNQSPIANRQFHAKSIGHPLIPADGCIYNDFTITELGGVVIITGSNMAGKSSFLRTLGINLVLAYAGGTAVADQLETRLFRIYSSMRVSDSVTSGYSFFYAEVRRLKALLDALDEDGGQRPLFFLIDEIFRGTNNRERLIGSRDYVRALVGQNGTGFIATHDLELIHLADETSAIRNYHFRDDVVDGHMSFDYKLHEGPCPTTNAIKIMRLAGLPISSNQN